MNELLILDKSNQSQIMSSRHTIILTNSKMPYHISFHFISGHFLLTSGHFPLPVGKEWGRKYFIDLYIQNVVKLP